MSRRRVRKSNKVFLIKPSTTQSPTLFRPANMGIYLQAVNFDRIQIECGCGTFSTPPPPAFQTKWGKFKASHVTVWVGVCAKGLLSKNAKDK